MSGANDRRSDLAVMDANEYKQKRRLKALLEAREKVEEKSDQAEELYVTGQIDEQARNTMLVRAVQEYIREGWTLLLNHAQERAEVGEKSEYLESRPLGSLDVGEKTIEFRGLYDVLTADEVYVDHHETVVEYPQGANEVVTQTEVEAVPEDVSWQAYLLMSEFLAEEHGLELQFEESNSGPDLWGFQSVDISDLDARSIEEVEEFIGSGIDTRALEEDADGGEDGDD